MSGSNRCEIRIDVETSMILLNWNATSPDGQRTRNKREQKTAAAVASQLYIPHFCIPTNLSLVRYLQTYAVCRVTSCFAVSGSDIVLSVKMCASSLRFSRLGGVYISSLQHGWMQ